MIHTLNCRGAATSIGEQPIKGLIDPEAGARLSVTEALTNLMFACITSLPDVKCSGNWMWPAKLEGNNDNHTTVKMMMMIGMLLLFLLVLKVNVCVYE